MQGFLKVEAEWLTGSFDEDNEEGVEYTLQIRNEDAGTRTRMIGITASQAERVLELLSELSELSELND
jgi:hypothetical protein